MHSSINVIEETNSMSSFEVVFLYSRCNIHFSLNNNVTFQEEWYTWKSRDFYATRLITLHSNIQFSTRLTIYAVKRRFRKGSSKRYVLVPVLKLNSRLRSLYPLTHGNHSVKLIRFGVSVTGKNFSSWLILTSNMYSIISLFVRAVGETCSHLQRTKRNLKSQHCERWRNCRRVNVIFM